MSDLESEEFRWRDTYFVWFAEDRKPTLAQLQGALAALPGHFELQDQAVDEAGTFESLTVVSRADNVALEITMLTGDDIRQQAETLAEEMKQAGEGDVRRLGKLACCDARFDVMQFDRVADEEADDDEFDPSTLLSVLGALARLVDGISVDPQSGLIV